MVSALSTLTATTDYLESEGVRVQTQLEAASTALVEWTERLSIQPEERRSAAAGPSFAGPSAVPSDQDMLADDVSDEEDNVPLAAGLSKKRKRAATTKADKKAKKRAKKARMLTKPTIDTEDEAVGDAPEVPTQRTLRLPLRFAWVTHLAAAVRKQPPRAKAAKEFKGAAVEATAEATAAEAGKPKKTRKKAAKRKFTKKEREAMIPIRDELTKAADLANANHFTRRNGYEDIRQLRGDGKLERAYIHFVTEFNRVANELLDAATPEQMQRLREDPWSEDEVQGQGQPQPAPEAEDDDEDEDEDEGYGLAEEEDEEEEV